MNASNGAAAAGGAVPPAAVLPADAPAQPTVRVWDPFVRIFHWSLVGLFTVAFATGDESERLHLAAGYAIAGLVLLRLVWGFVGSKHARFNDFVRSPGKVRTFMALAMRFRAPRVLGHNPAGGMMILALLAMLIGISATGFMMTTDPFWGAEWVEELHEALVYASLWLIVVHIAGVVFSSIEHGENLVKAMITGRKRAA
ncbi:MAG: cytochrome b/b6 domain-containing protein [Rhodospirillales bacterium]|jgi:cytochrome b|nr:cytochrome b/b6 domain-containing protein [Rhodospirillales bacterium]